MSRFLKELTAACSSAANKYFGSLLLKYATQADRTALESARLKKSGVQRLFWLDRVWKHLGESSEFTPEEERAMEAAVYLDSAYALTGWLKSKVEGSRDAGSTCLDAFLRAFGKDSLARIEAATAIISFENGKWLERPDGAPNLAGKYLLSMSDEELIAAGRRSPSCYPLLQILLKNAPDRVPGVTCEFLHDHAKDALHQHDRLSIECCRLLLDHDRDRYRPIVLVAARQEECSICKALAFAVLADCFPEEYTNEARDLNVALVLDCPGRDGFRHVAENAAFTWLLTKFGVGILPELSTFFVSKAACKSRLDALDFLFREFGGAASSAFAAALANPYDLVRQKALGYIIDSGLREHDKLILKCVEEGLEHENEFTLAEYINLAGRSRLTSLSKHLWGLSEHESKGIRKAAVGALERLGDRIESDAVRRIDSEKSETRAIAIKILAAAKTPSGFAALEARLEQESDESVRDEILLSLDEVWQARGRKVSAEEIQARISRTDLPGRPLATWIDEKKLPPLKYRDSGKPLDMQTVRYIFYRQSRAPGMQPDVECKPLYALIDRKTSGDFALTVLRMYLGRKQISGGRWAMAIAGILGDDRVIPILVQQIRTWAAGNHVILGQSATEVLAVLGSDAALCAIDAIALKYRTKKKIAKAATEALSLVAESQGITVDELGDRIVPWLSFEPCKPRRIEYGEKQIEIRIGLDFKLALRDVIKNKKVTSLPAGMPAEIKSEFKDLVVMLREVVKGQIPRIENLMVRQFRWTSRQWKARFRDHPVLCPFAVRLVWGVYDRDGRLLATFRALEDGTLTDEQDSCVQLPGEESDDAIIGVVHPLELSAEQRLAWSTHLGDYKVVSPFIQLERPILIPNEQDRKTCISRRYEQIETNGMSFRSRLDRLGWQRGAVGHGGMIDFYRKRYLGCEIDAILELDGMPLLGMDNRTTIRLGRFYFVKAGASAAMSAYDLPRNEEDPRLLSFGEVPPIVFSETLGDLAKIAGGKEGQYA
jgi:hypothetical protein